MRHSVRTVATGAAAEGKEEGMTKLVRCGLGLAACIVALALAASAGADGASQSTSPIFPFVNPNVTLDGYSTLVRNDSGVSATAHLDGLNAGGAYTMWWLFFNNPAACTHPVFTSGGVKVSDCGPADLATPAAAPSFQYADGHVVGGSGQATFAGHFSVGDTPQCALPTLPCAGLADARNAEVHLVIRSLGDAVPDLISDQIHSFLTGCHAGEPNAGQCGNIRVSIHMP
jgi:chitodextrinase